ncbi:MAG: hypothetical protein ABIO70_33305 [Pseudomonadota bacterium]
MEIRNDTVLTHPRALVYATYRDRLSELVAMLPNIEYLRVLSRRDDGETSFILNEWKAKGEIPEVAQRWIKPEMLRWKDHATWHGARWDVDWRLEMAFMQDRVSVAGTNRFVDLGPSRTRLELRGDLTIDARGMPGVPRLLAGKFGAIVERFVLGLVQPNLVKTGEALQRFLDEGR